MRLLRPFLCLTALHTRQLFRHPFFLLLTIATVSLTLLLPLVFSHTFSNTARRLASDGGLAFQWIAGIIMAATAAGMTSGYQRKTGTAAMLLAKPVSRTLLFLSHFVGMALLILMFSAATGLATLLADRIAETFTPQTGYRIDLTTAALALLCPLLACAIGASMNALNKTTFYACAFCLLPLLLAVTVVLTGFYDRAGNWTSVFSFTPSLTILPSVILIATALLMFCAMALTLALLFKSVTVTLAGFAILAAGLSSEWLIVEKLADAPLARGALALLPNWQRFWLASPSLTPSLPAFGLTALYACLYIAVFLTVGSIIFEQWEDDR